jgi:curved DNA-binding protein CbpA
MEEDPFEVLGVSPAADEGEIRQKYLARVREFPPDRAPDEFARTRSAYDALRDPVARMQRRLFDHGGTDTFDAIRLELIRKLRETRFTSEQLLKLAKSP